MDNHPITPSSKLINQWETFYFDEEQNLDVVLIQAYQAGADQELEACVEWLQDPELNVDTYKLRAARRPKPPSLKQQALEAWEQCWGSECLIQKGSYADTIRRAIEQLPDE